MKMLMGPIYGRQNRIDKIIGTIHTITMRLVK